MSGVWGEIAGRLREVTRDTVRDEAPPVQRGKVVKATPLIVDVSDDLVLEEGDEDVEFDEALLATRPAVGDVVRVHKAADGDYIVSGRIVSGG